MKSIRKLTCIACCLLGILNGCQTAQPKLDNMPDFEYSDIDIVKADCVVRYYQDGQSPYITEQQHLFSPDALALDIICREPDGTYRFKWKEKTFISSKDLTSFLSALPASFMNQDLASAIFYSFTAGAQLLNIDSGSSSELVKIEGQWYLPQSIMMDTDKRITLFSNTQTNQVNLIQLQDEKSGVNWMLKSYNMRYSKQLERLIPVSIDVFDIRNGIFAKRLIIKIEYKNISLVN